MLTDRFRRLIRLALFTFVVGAGSGCAWVGQPATPPGPSTAPEASSPGMWQVSEDLRISELRPDIWLHTSWRVLSSGHRVLSNGLIVREGNRVVLVDTAWGVELTEQLVGWIDTTLGLEIDRAVVTHFHADRMGGSPVLADRGIPFMGSELTRELGTDEGVPLPSPLVGLGLGKAVTFGSLEVFYPGPAHTRDNVVVWVPEAQVLFGGCAVRPGSASSAGNTADADVEEWPESIRRVQARYGNAEIVVPSHGEPGGAELLTHTLEIFERQKHDRS